MVTARAFLLTSDHWYPETYTSPVRTSIAVPIALTAANVTLCATEVERTIEHEGAGTVAAFIGEPISAASVFTFHTLSIGQRLERFATRPAS